MNAFSLAYRNLARQRRRTLLIEAVVAFGFAALALATGFMIQSFDSLRAAMIQQIGHLQVMHPSAATNSEETTLEFGIPHAVRARALAATVPSVVAVLPRIEWVGLVTNGTRSVPYLGLGVDPGPEFAAGKSSAPPTASVPAPTTTPSSRRKSSRRSTTAWASTSTLR